MAMPRARARNRAKARANAIGEHTERGFSRHMEGHRSHGSPVSNARKGGGDYPGADQLQLPGDGPGKAARGYAGMDREAMADTPTPSGATPRSMRVYSQE